MALTDISQENSTDKGGNVLSSVRTAKTRYSFVCICQKRINFSRSSFLTKPFFVCSKCKRYWQIDFPPVQSDPRLILRKPGGPKKQIIRRRPANRTKESYHGKTPEARARQIGNLGTKNTGLKGLPSDTDLKMCSLCGWNGPCEKHRKLPARVGGQYVAGNVIVVCPNCHKLADPRGEPWYWNKPILNRA